GRLAQSPASRQTMAARCGRSRARITAASGPPVRGSRSRRPTGEDTRGMEFVNKSRVQAGWTMGFDRDGRELMIVAVKATYAIPKNERETPLLTDAQVPLTAADVFTGDPGLSAPIYESDYAHRKPRCDVLLNGSAYAPKGKPTTRVTVSLQVGSMTKSFD